MNIVIAGATGYLGFKFIERLSSLQKTDVTMQIHNYNILLVLRNENVLPETLLHQKNISICNINKDTLQNRIADFSPDVIFCATCCYETDPEYLYKTVDANYVFPALLLQIASGLSKKVRFISIGTSLPSSLNLYSLTKKHFVELGIFFQKTGKIEFINIALESFYGIDEPNNRFITRSILLLKANHDLLLTNGTQKRDFVFIDDVLEVLTFLVNFEQAFSLAETGYTISVGSGLAPSIKELVLFLHEETHSESNLKFGAIAMRKDEPSTLANLSILRKLGYLNSLTHWKDGMRKVIRSIE